MGIWSQRGLGEGERFEGFIGSGLWMVLWVESWVIEEVVLVND